MKKILLVEICNYEDYPIGGYLSFAKQMLSSFDNQLLLVGLSTDETTVGEWSKKEINGIEYDYFSVMHSKTNSRKSLIPARLKSYLAVRKYRDKILSKGVDNVFIQTPEVFRSKIRDNLNNIINNEKKAINIEKGIYNYCIQEAKNRKIVRKWDNRFFTQLYIDRFRSII